jgi:hypothetical protein
MPSENYILLERTELNASAASVTFSNIPQSGYTDLKVVVSARSDAVDGGTASWMSTLIRVNGSSTGSHRFIYGDGSAANSSSNGSVIWTYSAGSNATANTFGNFELYIPNYASTTQFKSYSVDAVTENNATLSGTWLDAGLVSNNAAVTSLGFATNTGNFVAGSTFSLYGIAALGTTPVIAPKASGGNRIDNDGTYWYHTFTSSGTFTPLQGISCDVLQVAGGGGGGYWNGGGGGAGGLVAYNSQSLTAINYAITVGAGGNGGTTGAGSFGTNSQFASLTASNGGGGGAQDSTSAANGGGSGGGAGFGGTGGNATSGQGNVGGNGDNAGPVYGGGGGGAGGAGTAGTVDGKGGIGLTSSLTNAMGAATNTGELSSSNYYYAGGGSGGNQAGTTLVTGGLGGGGTSGTGYNATVVNPTAGTANTGGGGGGGTAVNPGAAGGSGIIIVRYPIA